MTKQLYHVKDFKEAFRLRQNPKFSFFSQIIIPMVRCFGLISLREYEDAIFDRLCIDSSKRQKSQDFANIRETIGSKSIVFSD